MTLVTERWSARSAVAVPARAGRQLSATIDHVAALDGSRHRRDVRSLRQLLRRPPRASLFEADLRNKDFVVTLREPSGALAGFSTLAVIEAEIGGVRLRAIYSGDTIIDHAHWGTQALAFTWIRFAGTIKALGARAAALLVPDRQGPPHLSLSLGLLGRFLSALGDADAGAGARRSWTSWRDGASPPPMTPAAAWCRFRSRAATSSRHGRRSSRTRRRGPTSRSSCAAIPATPAATSSSA